MARNLDNARLIELIDEIQRYVIVGKPPDCADLDAHL